MKAKTIVAIAVVLAVLACGKQRDPVVTPANGNDGAASSGQRESDVATVQAPPAGPRLAGLTEHAESTLSLPIEGRFYTKEWPPHQRRVWEREHPMVTDSGGSAGCHAEELNVGVGVSPER